MKIIINATNITEDRPLREADRLISKGLAHLPEAVLTDYIKDLPNKDFSNKPNKDKPVEITYEDLDGIASFTPKEEVVDIDLIEPIPVDKYVSFDEPEIDKPVRYNEVDYTKDSVIGGPKMFKKTILKAKKKLFHR